MVAAATCYVLSVADNSKGPPNLMGTTFALHSARNPLAYIIPSATYFISAAHFLAILLIPYPLAQFDHNIII